MPKNEFVFNKKDYESCLPEFKDIILHLQSKYDFWTYRGDERSMRNIELSIVYWMLKKFRPKTFFESGAWWGRCSYIIAESIKRLELDIPFQIAHIHKEERLKILAKDYPFVKTKKLPGEVRAKYIKTGPVGMLIDGPKWRRTSRMLELYEGFNSNNNEILFAVHHDVSRGHPEDRNNIIQFMQDNFDKYVFWDSDQDISPEARMLIDNDPKTPVMSGVLVNRCLL